MDDRELSETLSALDPAAFCDADKSIRVIDPALSRVNPGRRLIGRARTVRCFGDFLAVIEALSEARAGEVLVIDTQGTRPAVVGELFSIEAARRGLAGIVIDGGCRDTETIKALDIPVYASHRTPVSGTVEKLGENQIPIICGGVVVEPGEIVFGDSDGLIVLNNEELEALLPVAKTIKQTEQRVIAAMDRGESLINMTNLTQHLDALRSGNRASKLAIVLD